MQFSELTLYSAKLEAQQQFYTQLLELPLLEATEHSFLVRAGSTLIRFIARPDARPYHFAFNIPAYQEDEALEWLVQKVTPLPLEGDPIIDFSNWNAKAIYFYDADRNIVEFIARRNLKQPMVHPFSSAALLEVSEIGMPVEQIEPVYRQLREQYHIPLFSGSIEVFCAMGGEQGLFIIVDKNKKDWFPNDDSALSADFELITQLENRKVTFSFQDGKLVEHPTKPTG